MIPDSPRIFVVIPAFNEARVIAEIVARVRAVHPAVVVVDDGSTDETRAAAESAGAIVVRHAINRGQGAAIQTGLSYCLIHDADCVVTFDADGQHRVEDISRLLAPILARQAEVALGSRFLGQAHGITRSRWLLLKLAVLFTRIVSGLRVTDTHNGLRAFSRRAAQGILIRVDRMGHASELLDQIRSLDVSYVEVPVEITYTDYSRAKGQHNLNAIRVLFEYMMGRLRK